MSSIIETFSEDLIGVDKLNTVNAYYQRDLSMGLNNANTIISSLKKLGYYNLNINTEEETFIKAKLITWIKNNSYSDIINRNLTNIITEIKNTNYYGDFNNQINCRIEKNSQLTNYMNCTDTFDFYSALTIEELNHLGY